MKYLIVGLGNPGPKYENTRHNIGFKVIDKIAGEQPMEEVRHGWMTVKKHKGRQFLLLKPNTFMNLSGKAVNYWMEKEKIPIDRILIIVDDIALPFGTLRMKGKGSDGGHNGLKDIIATLNSAKFARLRFGVGSDFMKGQQVNYVLSDWTTEEEKALSERIKVAEEMVLAFGTLGLARAMNLYNNR